MINTASVEHATFGFKMLDEDQIQELLYATFDVMRTVGFKVLHEGACKMLAQAGAVVKDESVKIPQHIVQECVRLVEVQAEEREISLEVRAAPENPAIWADKTRLKQAILNLLSNAVKYNRDTGQVWIRWETVDDGRIRLSHELGSAHSFTSAQRFE